METFRCPTCLFMLTDPGVSRCPSCHKKLRRRDRPIVLGDKKHFGTRAPTEIDLLFAERAERAQASFNEDPLVASVPAPPAPDPLVVSPPREPAVDKAPVADAPPPVAPPEPVVAPPAVAPPPEAPPAYAAPPYVPAPPAARKSEPVQHTTIFEPSQFDPEMRHVLDSLYRKARSEPDEPG